MQSNKRKLQSIKIKGAKYAEIDLSNNILKINILTNIESNEWVKIILTTNQLVFLKKFNLCFSNLNELKSYICEQASLNKLEYKNDRVEIIIFIKGQEQSQKKILVLQPQIMVVQQRIQNAQKMLNVKTKIHPILELISKQRNLLIFFLVIVVASALLGISFIIQEKQINFKQQIKNKQCNHSLQRAKDQIIRFSEYKKNKQNQISNIKRQLKQKMLQHQKDKINQKQKLVSCNKQKETLSTRVQKTRQDYYLLYLAIVDSTSFMFCGKTLSDIAVERTKIIYNQLTGVFDNL